MYRSGSARTFSYSETAISMRSVQSPSAHSQITAIVLITVPKLWLRLSICSFTCRKIDSLRPTRLPCSSLMRILPSGIERACDLTAGSGLAHDEVIVVLLDDVAVARMAGKDGERRAVLANALVLRSRQPHEPAALDVVALAEVRNALERGVELLLGGTDPFVGVTERRLISGALLLFPRSHDPFLSPVNARIHIGIGSPDACAAPVDRRRLDQPRPRGASGTAAAPRGDVEPCALHARSRGQGREPGRRRRAARGQSVDGGCRRPGRARRSGARGVARSRRRRALAREGCADRDRADHGGR